MKRAPASLARRYARALLDVAIQGDMATSVGISLTEDVALLEREPDLMRVLLHPTLSAAKKKKMAAAVWVSHAAPLTRLLDLLIERRRLSLLPALRDAYVELWNERRGIVSAQATSATPLEPSQQRGLTEAAQRLVGREVVLATSVDPLLLGGIVLRMNGRTYDGSLRAQLRIMRARLAPGTATPSDSSTSRG